MEFHGLPFKWPIVAGSQRSRLAAAPARSHLHKRLTDKQERSLIYTLQVYSASNLALKTDDLREVVKEAFGIEVSEKWPKRFVKLDPSKPKSRRGARR